MKIIRTFLLIFALFATCSIHAQVSISSDDSDPDPSAMLDIKSTSKGVLFPRMTTQERDAISDPAESLMIFNTDTQCVEAWGFNSWQKIWCVECIPSEAPSGISGNNNICAGGNTDLSVQGGSLGTGAQWFWYKGECGGSPIGYGTSINVSPTSDTYYYVGAQGACGITECKNIKITVTNPPNAPMANAASNIGDKQFTANWQAASSATSYILQVSENNGLPSFVFNQNVGNVLSYEVSELECNTIYYYRVKAINSCGESSFSSAINLKTNICCDPKPCPGSETVLYNGFTYNTVLIGNQCWMMENLRTTKYRNGVALNSTWANTGTDGRHCNPGSGGDGLFYNFYAANHTNKLCPTGWRTPTRNDFATLIDNVPDAASIMDNVSWVGTNSCGWKGRNGGYRAGAGNYYDAQHGFYWTSNTTGSYADDFRLYNNLTYQINDSGSDKYRGQYVRCIKE